MSKSGPYSIGSDHWPGISKLAEESGEVQQVIGKLIGTGGANEHWDGSNLHERLQEEMADVMAACQFVIEANGLDAARIAERVRTKLETFWAWHKERTAPPVAWHPSHEVTSAPDAGFNGDYQLCRHCRRVDTDEQLKEPCPTPVPEVSEALNDLGGKAEAYAIARYSGIGLDRVSSALSAMAHAGMIEVEHIQVVRDCVTNGVKEFHRGVRTEYKWRTK